MKGRIDFEYEVEYQKERFQTKLICKLNGENLFVANANYESLLDVIDDARFHADSTIGLLRESIMRWNEDLNPEQLKKKSSTQTTT